MSVGTGNADVGGATVISINLLGADDGTSEDCGDDGASLGVVVGLVVGSAEGWLEGLELSVADGVPEATLVGRSLGDGDGISLL